MRVTILGSGGSTGVPALGGAGAGDWGACDPTEPRNRRLRSSIVIEGPQGRVLVDTGPDLRAQMLACAVPRIDALIFTHAHADHITGLDDVRQLNRITGAPLPTFGTARTMADIAQRFDYAFKPWTPGPFYRGRHDRGGRPHHPHLPAGSSRHAHAGPACRRVCL
jgi:phosphoribosyl 1,2-cyclic phosphate phosphodiesterase